MSVSANSLHKRCNDDDDDQMQSGGGDDAMCMSDKDNNDHGTCPGS